MLQAFQHDSPAYILDHAQTSERSGVGV